MKEFREGVFQKFTQEIQKWFGPAGKSETGISKDFIPRLARCCEIIERIQHAKPNAKDPSFRKRRREISTVRSILKTAEGDAVHDVERVAAQLHKGMRDQLIEMENVNWFTIVNTLMEPGACYKRSGKQAKISKTGAFNLACAILKRLGVRDEDGGRIRARFRRELKYLWNQLDGKPKTVFAIRTAMGLCLYGAGKVEHKINRAKEFSQQHPSQQRGS